MYGYDLNQGTTGSVLRYVRRKKINTTLYMIIYVSMHMYLFHTTWELVDIYQCKGLRLPSYCCINWLASFRSLSSSSIAFENDAISDLFTQSATRWAACANRSSKLRPEVEPSWNWVWRSIELLRPIPEGILIRCGDCTLRGEEVLGDEIIGLKPGGALKPGGGTGAEGETGTFLLSGEAKRWKSIGSVLP